MFVWEQHCTLGETSNRQGIGRKHNGAFFQTSMEQAMYAIAGLKAATHVADEAME